MIIRGFKTLEGLEQKLRALPEEKRKIIVLVGRHPNEGTVNIANRHHESWEKHGAVVVRIPAEWTPHFAWQLGTEEDWSARQIGRFERKNPSDAKVARFLLRSGFKVPVVNFHGTPFLSDRDKPRRMEFTKGIFSRISNHPYFVYHKLDTFRPRNELVAEFFYHGSIPGGTKMRRHWLHFEPSYFTELWALSSSPHIFHPMVTKESIRDFSRDHSKQFEEVLAHLAKTGLKPAKR